MFGHVERAKIIQDLSDFQVLQSQLPVEVGFWLKTLHGFTLSPWWRFCRHRRRLVHGSKWHEAPQLPWRLLGMAHAEAQFVSFFVSFFGIILKILYLDLVPWVPSCPILAMPNETSPATPSESQQFRKTPLKGHFRPQAQSFSPPSSHTAVDSK